MRTWLIRGQVIRRNVTQNPIFGEPYTEVIVGFWYSQATICINRPGTKTVGDSLRRRISPKTS
jgi:hypothetical protein